jgi:Flp pilus assembly protein TadD
MLRRARVSRALRLAPLIIAAAALGACTATKQAEGAADLELTTASVPAAAASNPDAGKPLDEVKDDLALGKEHYRATNYGLAELHFRRATEAHGNAEAWLGLAAAYDQLRRFELADRAYQHAFKLTGPTPEVLNNRGYSYLLRGDIRRASQDLSAAAAGAPENERIRNNLKALDSRARRRV